MEEFIKSFEEHFYDIVCGFASEFDIYPFELMRLPLIGLYSKIQYFFDFLIE
jgi:hypothetical protein